MRKRLAPRNLLGAAVVALCCSSCADPTNSNIYVDLEGEREQVKSSISRLEEELSALDEELSAAEKSAKEASLENADLEREVSSMRDVKSNLIQGIEEKESEIVKKELSLQSSRDELERLVEAYG